jgi:hypothetical protein
MNYSFLYYQRNEDKPKYLFLNYQRNEDEAKYLFLNYQRKKTKWSICSSTIEGTKTKRSIHSSTIEGMKTKGSIRSSTIDYLTLLQPTYLGSADRAPLPIAMMIWPLGMLCHRVLPTSTVVGKLWQLPASLSQGQSLPTISTIWSWSLFWSLCPHYPYSFFPFPLWCRYFAYFCINQVLRLLCSFYIFHINIKVATILSCMLKSLLVKLKTET